MLSLDPYQKFEYILASHYPSIRSIAGTSDIWTSRNDDPICALTLQYIPEDFNLYAWVPWCKFFPGQHTGEAIVKVLDKSIADLKLSSITTIYFTTDNGTNIIKATDLSRVITEHFSCICHNLQLAIYDALKTTDEMMSVVDRCKHLAAHVHKSSLANQLLKEIIDKGRVCKVKHSTRKVDRCLWHMLELWAHEPEVSSLSQGCSHVSHQVGRYPLLVTKPLWMGDECRRCRYPWSVAKHEWEAVQKNVQLLN